MQTYNPILTDRDLSRFRVSALSPPRLGTALVLVPHQGGLVRVDPGGAVPGARLGHYRSAYVIDTAEHDLAIPAQLPSADSAFVFQAVIHCRCRVQSPEQVATRQLRDVGALVKAAAVPRLRPASAEFDIGDSARAEAVLAKALNTAVYDTAIAVVGDYVELPVHADEASAARSLRDAVRNERVLAVATDPLREAISSGVPGILARHLAANPTDTAEAVELLVGGEMVESEQMLNAISILVGGAGKDGEAFETWDARKKLMDRFITRVSSGGGLSPGGRRSAVEGRGGDGRGASRVRGALLAGPAPGPGSSDAGSERRAETPAEPPIIAGSVVEAGAERDPDRDREKGRRSRVVLPRADGPRPSSEPAPGPKSESPRRRVARDPDREAGE